MSQLNCKNFSISLHALKAMLQRNISVDEVVEVANNGEIIAEYVNDKPFPSFLMLQYISGRPIHIVIAKEFKTANCIVVTCYHPDSELWDVTFTKKYNDMECIICKVGRTKNGKTNFTIEKNGAFLIYKDVDADICDNCGEAYFSIETSRKIEQLSAEAVKKGTELEVVRF
jgi:YgiT-type zinc finger domain-containing protein